MLCDLLQCTRLTCQKYRHKEAQELFWPVLKSLCVFVWISSLLLLAGQWMSIDYEQRDLTASTKLVKCTCTWLFSPCVLVKKDERREKLRLKHTSIPRRLERLFIQRQTAGVFSDKNIIPYYILYKLWWCIFEFGLHLTRVYFGWKMWKELIKKVCPLTFLVVDRAFSFWPLLQLHCVRPAQISMQYITLPDNQTCWFSQHRLCNTLVAEV